MTNIHSTMLSVKLCLLKFIIVLSILFLWNIPANATPENPLKPIDTSSPRTTLLDFIEFMDKGYATGAGLVNTYLDTQRLYLSAEEVTAMRDSFHYQEAAQRSLDLSQVPPSMRHESARRLAVQLKEILDRIDLPPVASIPDAEAMAKAEFKTWTYPNSEIRIRRIESGPRAGEYLFSSETVSRIPEFYERVKELPYKAGASEGWYDFASYSPVGIAIVLHQIVPSKWMVDTPRHRIRAVFLDQPLWRWCGVVVILGAGFWVLHSCFRISRRMDHQTTITGQWLDLLRPISLVIVMPILVFILAEILRVSAPIYQVLTLSMWTVFYLALTWAVWVFGGAAASSLSEMEKLQIGSIDSQLIRLVMRLLTVVASILIIVTGADRVGLPAYSVLAGLGVGGLAVALAAQQTLANLLGSLIIMFEKPFGVGDSIKLKDVEGIVENVGFRSTRIRTSHNSLVTIPSSQLVNSIVDNMALRQYRQLKTVLNLTYDTPIEKIEAFIQQIRHMLEVHPDTRKDNIRVVLNNLGANSIDILLDFFIKVSDSATELNVKQQILIDILRLAETVDVKFAFPTQTFYIENLPGQNAMVSSQTDTSQNREK